ncbi:hypothetical protein QP858_00235 [Trueperella bernardiae]|uniref:Uncharacterized protein n=1 Tax=Trueperella bernardiae TaxID=59561 RepID=A0AAW6ZH94_9ACTO|nr:hypothetical protein [Trueperella bernardiae]MDK8600896.1 hypothetical protein [Trueperella bernardiae]
MTPSYPSIASDANRPIPVSASKPSGRVATAARADPGPQTVARPKTAPTHLVKSAARHRGP